jgi:hypothetical protein
MKRSRACLFWLGLFGMTAIFIPPSTYAAGNETPQASQEEVGSIDAGLAAIGSSITHNLNTKPARITLTIEQDKFLEAVPRLQAEGILNTDISKLYINEHPFILCLAQGIQEVTFLVMDTYQKNASVDAVHFEVSVEYADDYGNSTTKPMFSFDFNRELFNKINWNSFKIVNLIKIAPHFHYSIWIQQQIEKEKATFD